MTTSNALNYYRDLIKSGVPDQQAYDQTAALERALEHLSTKEDLLSSTKELSKRIDVVYVQMAQDKESLNTKIDDKFSFLDAKIDSSVSFLDAKIDSSVSSLDSKIDSTFSLLDAKIDSNFSILDTKIEMTQKWGLSLLIAIFVMGFKISFWDIPKIVVTKERSVVVQKKEITPIPVPKQNKNPKTKE